MRGQRHDRGDLIMLVGVIDVDAILGQVDDARLQTGIDTAERHVSRLRTIGGEHRVLGRCRLDTDLHVLDVIDAFDLFLAIQVTWPQRQQGQNMRVLHRFGEHRLHFIHQQRAGYGVHQMLIRPEQIMDRQHTGLRRNRRGVGGGTEDEIDVAGADFLQHLRLLPQLTAGELVDDHRTAAEFGQLRRKQIAADTVSRGVWLIVSKAVMLNVGRTNGRCEQRGRRQCSK